MCYVVNVDDPEEITTCEVCQLKRGTLKLPFDKLVAGVGYVGIGQYVPRPKGQDKSTSYIYWSNMMTRVYRRYGKLTCYEGVEVHEDWHNFQTYSDWLYSQVGYDKGWHVDKDLLGGKVYSKDNCLLVPPILNSFAVGIYKDNGLPSGVYYSKSNRKYTAQLSNSLSNKRECIGCSDDLYEAANLYKIRKEAHLAEVLDSPACKDFPLHSRELLLERFKVPEFIK